MNASIDLIVEDDRWRQALPELEAVAVEAAAMAVGGAGVGVGCEVSILACDDAAIAGLNRQFRQKDGPTNVLSWPSEDLSPGRPGGAPGLPEPGPSGPPVFLGDLALALETCRAEAESADIPLKFHVRHLILHGCLHLLGYDHVADEDAALMEGIESRLLTKAGYPDPYA